MLDQLEQEGSDLDANELFREPEDFLPLEKPATFTSYTTQDGHELNLRLVGSSPLWGHLLWNAGQVTAKYLEDNANELVKGKNILELGAGSGLPSLVCALHQPSKVVVTDYPDPELVANLQYNIDHAIDESCRKSIVARGFVWGSDITPIKKELQTPDDGFDLVIMADILFNHIAHEMLLETLKQTLRRTPHAQALVFFTPYRPWLLQKDLNFFELARQAGFHITKLFEHIMEKAMFPDDPGDETLRKTVFAYQIKWPN